MIIELLILAGLIVLNGLLAMSEMAIVSSRPSRLKAMVDQRAKGARRALALAADPGRFLSTVQIGITLIGILAGTFSGATIGDRLAAWLVMEGISETVAEALAVGGVVTVITYLSLIVGELVPKQIALGRPEVVACTVAPMMTQFSKFFFPLVWLLGHSSKLLLRLMGHQSAPETRVTEEEIKTLVAEAETSGVLSSEERAMISGVMRLADRPIRGVMTPKMLVDFVDLSDSSETIRRKLRDSTHSRIPVRDGSADHILGVLQAKDVLDVQLAGNELDLRSLIKQVPVVPDTMDALDVVEVLKQSAVHIGLVHDEYGHFEGVITSSDILAAIVGGFRTEEGEAEQEIVLREDGSFLVAGAMAADEFSERFSINLPASRDYHTVAGIMLTLLRRIPKTGEHLDAFGFRFEIVDLDGRRIDKVLVKRLER